MLLEAVRNRWDAAQLRRALGSLVNDEELRQAQETADKVDSYLGGG